MAFRVRKGFGTFEKRAPGQSFPLDLSLCGPTAISRANAHIVYALKHQHFTLHSITLFVLCNNSFKQFLESSVAERLRRRICNPVIPCSNPTLTMFRI